MKFKAIIFDFDGVLFDSESIHLQACNKVFHALGFNVSEEEYFKNYVGLSDNEMFPLILKDKKIKCDSNELNMLKESKINAYKNIINNSAFLDAFLNVKDFIISCSKIIDKFAICSGSTREEVETTLNKLENGELQKYFHHITTIEDVNIGKPSPAGYLLTANRLGISPQSCLAIEDTQKGATAAKNAGMRVAAISLTNANITNVDIVARNYTEIDDWIRGYDINES